jgi:hypothetical protein
MSRLGRATYLYLLELLYNIKITIDKPRAYILAIINPATK